MTFSTDSLYQHGSSMAKAAFVGASTTAGAALGFATGAAIGGAKGLYHGVKTGYGIMTADIGRDKDDAVAPEYVLKAIPAIIAPVAYGTYGAISEGVSYAYQGGKMAYKLANNLVYPETAQKQESEAEKQPADKDKDSDPIEAHIEGLLIELENGEPTPQKNKGARKSYLPSHQAMQSKEKELLSLLVEDAKAPSLSSSAPARP